MSSRTIILISIVLGLAAALLSFRLIGPSYGGGGRSVLVVAVDGVKPGAVIMARDLSLKSWPKSSIPPGAYINISNVVGRVSRQEIFKGEPILEDMLVPAGSRGGLASIIPLGKRAITVHVNEVVAVAGFALPGSYVDVLASVKDSHDKAYSKTVLNRVKVLAVAQETNGDPSKPKVVNAVTLELTSKEAERLDVARSAGALSLALLNEGDISDMPERDGTRYAEVFKDESDNNIQASNNFGKFKKSKLSNTPIAAKIDSVEVIKGTTRAEVNF